MKMAAPLSSQDANARPVAAASSDTPSAIFATVVAGMVEDCFMVLIYSGSRAGEKEP